MTGDDGVMQATTGNKLHFVISIFHCNIIILYHTTTMAIV